MSYAGLGQLLTGGLTISPTGFAAPPQVDPNAWRATLKKNAIDLANATSVGGREWSPFVTKLVRIAAMSSSGTPQAILAEVPVEPFYSGSWKSTWPGDMFSRARSGVAAIKSLLTEAAKPALAPAAPKLSISPLVVKTPMMTTVLPQPLTTVTPTPYVPAEPPPEITYMPDSPVVTTPPVVPGGASIDLPTWDTSAMPPTPVAPIAPPAPAGLLGVSWKIWGLGAVVLVGGFAASRVLKANRRRVRRNRRRR